MYIYLYLYILLNYIYLEVDFSNMTSKYMCICTKER